MHNSQSKVNMKVYIETVFNKVTFKSASFHIWIFGLTNANFCLRFEFKTIFDDYITLWTKVC